jgi:stage III sporulation protein AG
MAEVWNRLTERFPFLRTPQIWQLLLIFGAGVLLLMFTGSWFTPKSSSPASPPAGGYQTQPATADDLTTAEKELEGRLAQALSQVDGAGSVQVTVTLKAGTEHVYAQNVTKQDQTVQQRDQNGGTSTTNDVNETNNLVLLQPNNGGQTEPVVVKDLSPEIAGVLVLADGARDPELKLKLIQAVQTVLDVPMYRVTVLPKERE